MTHARRDRTVHTLFIRRPPRLQRSPVSLVLLMFLLILLGACDAGTPPTTAGPQATTPPTRIPTPTPTALPAGIVLYQANWSHGISSWPQTQGWEVVQGLLESDTSGSSTFILPYQSQVSDYALEIRLRIVRLLSQKGGTSFALFARKATGKDGYAAGVDNIIGTAPHPMGSHPAARVFLDPYSDEAPGTGLPSAFSPPSGWHTYRVEVQGNEARLLLDGEQGGGNARSVQNTISNGPLGLNCQGMIMSVSSIRILSL